MRAARAFIVAGLTLCGCLAVPRVPAAPPRQASLALSISSYLLANGLEVVVVKDPHAPEVQVTMRYRVGAVDDPPAHPGMAHLVEHLMYEQVLDGESLLAKYEDVATFFNATTTHDATTYVARAGGEHLEDLLGFEASRVQLRCASVTESAFAREREVVVNELRQRDQATEILGAIAQALYPTGHPYRRNVGGTVDSVTAITRDEACAFADAHYAPNNAVLVVSGNITPAQEHAIFTKYVAQAPKRAVTAAVPIYPVPFQPWFVTQPVPIDDDALLAAWPVPADPAMRAKVRAFVVAMASLIDNEIAGSVTPIELGDTRSPMVGIVIFPAPGETFQHAREGMERGVARLPGVLDQTDSASFGELAFDRIQQTAIYQLYATLEDGGDRDTRLASFMLAGGDPRTVFQDELGGLRDMNADDAAAIARTYLTLQTAKVVVLDAAPGKKRGNKVALAAAIHDLGQRRHVPDLADAHRAATSGLARHELAMTTRTLPNGLRVVLLPSTSVPTVEMRLVFGVGAADEPADKRGVAQVAANALSWDMRYLKDLMLFAAVGGTKLVDVGLDRTTFAAHGVDMNLDYLLAGLRRWVREGTYDESVDTAVDAQRRARKKRDDDGPFTDAWRTAVFGAGHPYAHAGLARHGSTTLAADDAARFRAAYYTPDNATLVIAGRFDAALADRWIDYLFTDWEGHAKPRQAPRAALQPTSIAKIEDLAQVQLRIAMPATASSRAARLVAAEMLSQIAGDVRHQLGATYDLTAQLSEQRLALTYVIGGWIDSARASSAVELLRDRIGALGDADTAARAFVTARRRVMTHLTAITGSAELLAVRVERDVEMGRAPMTDLATAAEVQRLTIEQMTGALADLSLSRAVVAMRGPADDIAHAFAVLDRTPAQVAIEAAAQDAADDVSAPGTRTRRSDEMPSELADPLTLAPRVSPLVLAVDAGYVSSEFVGRDATTTEDASGGAVALRVGRRLRGRRDAGVHAGIGSLHTPYGAALVPIDVAGYFRYGGDGGLSAAAIAGLHVERSTFPSEMAETYVALGVAGELAYDLMHFDRSWLGFYARIGVALGETDATSFHVGLRFHR